MSKVEVDGYIKDIQPELVIKFKQFEIYKFKENGITGISITIVYDTAKDTIVSVDSK